ncbi:MAG: bifunctional diaminohydroxyphosphoribosylaminopyrimidine deaminase/5-amino-6-(5-phosphoribosylamino)uracil reductase RibD [Pseudomonadota bacterium]
MFSSTDTRHMAQAVRLAARGRFWARPNPHVGCVIAQGDTVIAEGFTQPAGGDHAEAMALGLAGTRAQGATAYVTLEPCSHFGRTPPCAQALVDAGIARVVFAVGDPNPKVDGGGAAALEAAGVKVDSGLLADQVERQLAGFLSRFRQGRPYVRMKLAASLDGRTAMASGESQWITGPHSRNDVQRLRAESCAIVTGIGTVLADDCALTVRDEHFQHELLPSSSARALRVVLDSQGRTPAGAKVLAGEQPSLIVVGDDGRQSAASTGAEYLALAHADGAIDLQALATELAHREVNELLVECGPRLAGAWLRSGLVDQLIVYQAPKLLGSTARPLLELPLETMAEVVDLTLQDRRQLGPDQRLTFRTTSRD